jgi:NADPH-dependent ferric siderophore reductase
MLEQAQRQFRAARGTPIRWIVAEEKLAGALRKLFKANGLDEIEVIHVPPALPP